MDMTTARLTPEASSLVKRMGDACHPGPLGRLIFYREISPFFPFSLYFPWEGNGDEVSRD
ncbi:MAG: hypothetical protein IT440_01620 [Phycisphaeraceae bacterium]|nr:hypothetical protein [Phycisphaeraceae bacterium]